MLQSDAHELHQIFRQQPDRQPPLVGRSVQHMADAQAGHAQAVLSAYKAPSASPNALLTP